MRTLLLLPFFALLGLSNSQGQIAGFAVTLKHDTILLYGTKVSMSAADVTYDDADGRSRSIKQSKLSDLYLGVHHFINSPISSLGMDRLQRIVMKNERYMLTSYFGGSKWVYYIYDKRTKEALVKKVTHSANAKNDLKSMDKYILPYFKDCPDALQAIRSGLTKEAYKETRYEVVDRMFGVVSNYDCEKAGESGL